MRNYTRIANTITSTPWLITSEGLDLILSIVDARIKNGKLTDEELAIKLESASKNGAEVDSSGSVVNGVGILPVYGPIFGKANLMTELSGATSMEAFRRDFKAMVADKSIKSILLDFDTPGGTSEMIAEAADEIFAARDIKPVYAIANNMACSAGYYLLSQASKAFMTPSGSGGNIGVYTVHKDQSEHDKQQGFKYTYISAAPYKVEGNPHEPLSAEGESFIQELINDVYTDFVNAVARGRGIESALVESQYGGGRTYPAKRALKAGMIDGIMEYDALLESMIATTAPQITSVLFNGEQYPVVLADDGTITIDLSNTDYEHSEPGTGSPPAPRKREDTDIAIESGSRRPDLTRGLGSEENEPGAPKATAIEINKGVNVMNLEQLMKLFGVNSEEALEKAITDMHAATTAASNLTAQEQKLAKEFPDVWAGILKDRDSKLKYDAKEFVINNKDVKGQKNLALSALAMETVETAYCDAAAGKLDLTAFKAVIGAIMGNGIVEYGERGTTTEPEQPEFDTNSATGIAALRQLFAGKVSEIQTKDKLSYADALAETARQYPDLAEAYRATAAVR